MTRPRWAVVSMVSFLVSWTSTSRSAAQDDLPVGVVLLVGDVPEGGATGAATEVGGAAWRSERLVPKRLAEPPPPRAALDAIETLYADGDFPRCLAALTDPTLDVGRLLGEGHPDEASRLLIGSGACTVAAGDADRGRELFRRAFILELDVEEAIRDLRPDIAEVAESARQQVLALRRVELTIDAPGAKVGIDGRPARCDRAPCTVRLFPGSHYVTLAALGKSIRTERIDVSTPMRIAPQLDTPSPEQARALLSDALARGHRLETSSFGEAAADAYGARVIVLVDGEPGQLRAALYDRARRAFVSRQTIRGAGATTETAVRNAIVEWQGEIETGTPAWVWVIVGASLIVAGVAAYLLIRPEASSYSIQF